MRIGPAWLVVLLAGALSPARAEQPDLRQWPSPPFWMPERHTGSGDDSSPFRARVAESRRTTLGVPLALPFFSLSPCRLVDTRGNGAPLAGGFLQAATVRSYKLTGVCGIPAGALAVSLNATAVDPVSAGFLVLWEEGQPFPPVSTLNFKTAETVANAAVVPLSPDGSILVAFGVSGADLILDTNGYYAAAPVVTSLNALTGDVLLQPGANVTLTPAGNVLTISATGGPGGPLPSGTAGQTLRSNGSSWVPNDALRSDGTNVSVSGSLALPAPVSVTSGGAQFLSNPGTNNTFLGTAAGQASSVGQGNTGFGTSALAVNAITDGNTAVGTFALAENTGGFFNTALGYTVLLMNHTGSGNTGIGLASLQQNLSGGANVAVGQDSLRGNKTGALNTAIGSQALLNNDSGDSNTGVGYLALGDNRSGTNNVAIGSGAMRLGGGSFNTLIGSGTAFFMTSGDRNIIIGFQAAMGLDNGSNNIFVGASSPAFAESDRIRIGTPGSHSAAFIAGIRGTTTSLNDTIPVVIDSAGQLGTVSSSARVKHEIRDMAEESDRLMRLRPVTFRYKGQSPDGPRQFGLVAEEVEEVLPELVVRNRHGEIETVKYHELPAMLLNELQKMERRAEAAEEALKVLEKRLARLEAAAGPAAADAGR